MKCFCCNAPTKLALIDYRLPICEGCLCQLTAHVVNYSVQFPDEPYRVALAEQLQSGQSFLD